MDVGCGGQIRNEQLIKHVNRSTQSVSRKLLSELDMVSEVLCS